MTIALQRLDDGLFPDIKNLGCDAKPKNPKPARSCCWFLYELDETLMTVIIIKRIDAGFQVNVPRLVSSLT